ncbi:MAG: DUF2220 domain-containing protein [Clostridia bacterium]|nr:DUF2220 domain-containing protein [Clostridia bacterium]
MDFKAHILNSLLDKYENSLHYQGKAKINRKITFSISQKNLPWYYDGEQPHLKKAIHQIVDQLSSQGIVFYKWLPYEKGNLLDCVWLNLEKIELAYKAIERIPKRDQVREAVLELEDMLSDIKLRWLRDFIMDCLEELKEKKNFPLLFPLEKVQRDFLFKAFKGLEDKNDAVILERIFSIKYLGHSKAFQKEVKRLLAKIANQYLIKNPDFTEEEIITELGIEKNSEEILVWGPISLQYGDTIIDYSKIPFGGVIDAKYLQDINISVTNVSKVITVENKTNFHYLVNQGDAQASRNSKLLIYVGGFPGPKKRRFLEVLYNMDPSISFYHWGDIDLGGFKIFNILRKVIPTLEPLFMDEDTLLKYKDYCDEIDNRYIKQLEILMKNENYKTFWPVIKIMIRKKMRLEQEALLTEDKLDI